MSSRNYPDQALARVGGLAAAVSLVAVVVGCQGAATTPSVTVGPTPQAVATQAAPTVAAAATQALPTAQAIATQAAPTVAAAQTQAAPTAQALATQAAPVAATITASVPVRVTSVNAASNDSTVVVQNVGMQPADLSNWTLQVGTARTQLPAGVNVPPGQSVTLHTGSGTNTSSNVYLGQEAQALATQLKPGVQIVLENPAGSPVTSFVVPNG